MHGTCASCGVYDGHARGCALQEDLRGMVNAVDHLTPEINDAINWDDRKTLSDIWQMYAPLPTQGLTEGTYDALMTVAKWGARRALEAHDE